LSSAKIPRAKSTKHSALYSCWCMKRGLEPVESRNDSEMGNSNKSGRRLSRHEQTTANFDAVLPGEAAAGQLKEAAALQPLTRQSSKTLNRVAPSPTNVDTSATAEQQEQEQQEEVMEESSALPSFDFSLTEGQTRRTLMADCEFECSQISPFVFVGGSEVAKSWDLLQSNGITQVVNFASSVVDSHFVDTAGMSYLALNMVDGRQDDVSWFFCQVFKLINECIRDKKRVLLHCEKGISRSCSFAIAHHMISQGLTWKEAFDYVKSRRSVCNPNTAFTCNLMEIGELTTGKARQTDMMLRLASHLPHDEGTWVLKPCRDASTRGLLQPSTELLHQSGCFVLRPKYCLQGGDDSNNSSNEEEEEEDHSIYVWRGAGASRAAAEAAHDLAAHLIGVFAPPSARIVAVEAGREPGSFWRCCRRDAAYSASWTDLVLPSSVSSSSSSVQVSDSSSSKSSKSSKEASETDFPKKPSRGLPPRPSSSSSSAAAGQGGKSDEVRGSSTTSLLGASHAPYASGGLDASPPSTPLRKDSFDAVAVTGSSGGGVGVVLGAGTASASAELLMMRVRSNSKVSSCGSLASTSSPSGGFAPTATLSTSSLPLHATPNSSSASLTLDRRTPSVDKYPREASLIREPTPVEDLLLSLVRKSSPLPSSREDLGVAVGPAASSSSSAVVTSAAAAAAAVPSKPLLFQAVPVTDGESDCIIKVFCWQSLGVYDDDDLLDTSVLLLFVPGGKRHFLWVGQDFDVSEVVDMELEDLENDEEHMPLRSWACRVLRGELAVAAKASLEAALVSVQLAGQESEEWWTAFSEGF
jgi:hypothetical protein